MKPTVVKVIPTSIKANKKATSEASDEGEPQPNVASRESAAITVIDDTPTIEQGPFSDPVPQATSPKAHSPRTKGHTKNGSLSAVIEEASKKTQSDASTDQETKKKDETPFGDEHATD
jgi:hypothetical protein